MKDFLKEESLKKFEDSVTEIEKSTSAEIVIAIAKFSASYRDVPVIFGFILSVLALVFILIVPYDIHLLLVTPLVIAVFFIGYFICSRCEPLLKLLTSDRRRQEQAKSGSKIAFFEEQVSATRDRTGILFYISLFEKRVEILTDLGIDGKISRDKWNSLSLELTRALSEKNSVDKFTEKLLTSIEILSKTFPPGEENPDEIPNRPRIRG